MIKEALSIAEGFKGRIIKQIQDEIRKEVEYNTKLFQDGIFKGVEKSIDYAKTEITFFVVMLFTLLLGTLFLVYGASVFLDKMFFNGGGVGFIVVGAFSLFIAVILMIARRK
ncbi:MAG: hypothetical protein CVT90_01660 [Candidatus Altiarchaeales archaeon HGW-Altiarchaeales-3]|nr:MAG: hypothetical protein CVT90_01660 [Candidatus Altiarchaeales archaeon HGW-Altiarchaeales-3]